MSVHDTDSGCRLIRDQRRWLAMARTPAATAIGLGQSESLRSKLRNACCTVTASSSDIFHASHLSTSNGEIDQKSGTSPLLVSTSAHPTHTVEACQHQNYT